MVVSQMSSSEDYHQGSVRLPRDSNWTRDKVKFRCAILIAILGVLAALIAFSGNMLQAAVQVMGIVRTWIQTPEVEKETSRLQSTSDNKPRPNSPPHILGQSITPLADVSCGGLAYGHSSPPTLRITVEDDHPFPKDPVQVHVRRARPAHRTDGSYAHLKHVQLLRGREDKMLTAILRTAPLVRDAFPKPHGVYLVAFEFKDADGATATHSMSFGYVATQEMLKGTLWQFNDTAFEYVPSAGLRIHPYSRRGGFVSADVAIAFGFKSDFAVWGRFTIVYADPNRPAALDVDFCDRRGERVAAIFGDGGPTRFSLKRYDEAFGDIPVNIDAAVPDKPRPQIVADGKTDNYFCIYVRHQNSLTSLWSIYIGQSEPDPEHDLPVHCRLIPNHVVSKGPLLLNLKAWRRGRITLSSFNIAELPKTRIELAHNRMEGHYVLTDASGWHNQGQTGASLLRWLGLRSHLMLSHASGLGTSSLIHAEFF